MNNINDYGKVAKQGEKIDLLNAITKSLDAHFEDLQAISFKIVTMMFPISNDITN